MEVDDGAGPVTVLTAWDALSYDGDCWFRIVGGRTLYEAATFYDHTPGVQVKLARLDTRGGRLRQINRYVDPDTLLELINPTGRNMAAKRKHPKPPGVEFDQEYELVEVDRLKEHPQNPRRGVEDAIDESIEINGWYGAVTAQKSTGYILAGNHRYRVAVRRGAESVPTIWRDVDDETAIRILLADNKTADLGDYDEELLTELLEGLETLDGTGYGLAAVEAAEEAEEGAGGPEGALADEVPDDAYTPQYGVMVVCDSEEHQEKVYEALSAQDYKLRVVAV